MTTVIATKVFDKNCEICKHMSRHDKSVIEGFPEIAYQETDLDDIISHGNDLTKIRVYQCLERHAINADYTIDLPVYVFLRSNGKFLGHHVGAATLPEFREKVKQILAAKEVP
jgi:hypothetical protein